MTILTHFAVFFGSQPFRGRAGRRGLGLAFAVIDMLAALLQWHSQRLRWRAIAHQLLCLGAPFWGGGFLFTFFTRGLRGKRGRVCGVVGGGSSSVIIQSGRVAVVSPHHRANKFKCKCSRDFQPEEGTRLVVLRWKINILTKMVYKYQNNYM